MKTVALPPMLMLRGFSGLLESSGASPSDSRSCLTHVLRPSAPGSPPSTP